MSMAARMGDPTAHGGSIVLGLPTVLIGGAPAARVTDMHACPMVTPGLPPIPHVGGPILMGFPMVLVGNLPQARDGGRGAVRRPARLDRHGLRDGAGRRRAVAAVAVAAARAAAAARRARWRARPRAACGSRRARRRLRRGRWGTAATRSTRDGVAVVGDLPYVASVLRALRAIAARETGRAARHRRCAGPR
jgi:uncharacterized Zn-binding protein involved in type VI secretion